MSYYNEKTGILMPAGTGLNSLVRGSTGIQYFGVTPIGSGYGQVYGIFWDTGNYPTVGLAKHTKDYQVIPTPTGYIYDSNFTGEIKLYFKVNLFSGYKSNLNPLFGDNLTGINFSGTSGIVPSGKLMHREIYKLLPNYGKMTSDVLTGDINYTIYRGGIYPEMLQDNIITINLQITWSGASGDALDC